MAFQHRKFLQKPEKFDEKHATPCYMCYICPDDCSSYLSPPPPPPPHPPTQQHQISTILILMLCVLSAAFVLLSYLTIIRYRSRRRNSRPSSLRNGVFIEDFIDENQGPILDHHIWFIRTVGLPQPLIDSIAVFRYKDGEGLIEGRDCSVCLSEFEEGESLRLLPKCSHAFHLPCIDTWLRAHKNCPVCRAPVLINTDTDSNTGRVGSVETGPSSGSSEENRTMVEPESDESLDTRGVVENHDVMLLKDRFRVVSDLADRHRGSVGRDLNPVRRSFSMDFSMICTKKDEESSGVKIGIIEKQNLEMVDKRGGRNTIVCNKLI